MSCCVVGGAGFIGRTLVRHLADSGREVIVLGRSAEPALPLDPRARYIACEAPTTLSNVLDASALQRISEWRPRIVCADGIRRVWEAQRAALQV